MKWLTVVAVVLFASLAIAEAPDPNAPEQYYIQKFCDRIGGKMNVAFPAEEPFGDISVVDCMTATTDYVVEFDGNWSHAVGRVLALTWLNRKKPGIVLITEPGIFNHMGIVLKAAALYKIPLHVEGIWK